MVVREAHAGQEESVQVRQHVHFSQARTTGCIWGLTVVDGSAILRGIHPSPPGRANELSHGYTCGLCRKYQTIRMERRHGILQMTFQTSGHTLQGEWRLTVHREFPQAFHDIASDPDNKVVIMTGTGEAFSGLQRHPDAREVPYRLRRCLG